MAEYVGHIFKISNKVLRLPRRGTHYVHVTWFNPRTKMFRCKIITSLERQMNLPKDRRQILSTGPSAHIEGDTFNLYDARTYKKLRAGVITPIPTTKSHGFPVWSGYFGVRELGIQQLVGNKSKNKHIDK